jgi:hypothetical protein
MLNGNFRPNITPFLCKDWDDLESPFWSPLVFKYSWDVQKQARKAQKPHFSIRRDPKSGSFGVEINQVQLSQKQNFRPQI